MIVKCINNDLYKFSLELGKEYEAEDIKGVFYGLIDETGEKYGFPAQLFEVIKPD